MGAIKPLIAGNWKMNGLRSATAELHKLMDALEGENALNSADVLVCPPATLIMAFAHIAGQSPLAIGAQDCHSEAAGAFTGDLSAEMLADAGAVAVILGHSERRSGHGERDSEVRAKAQAAHRAGLTAIICIGETAGERRLGLTLPVIRRQLLGSLPESANAANTVIAYEPIWAIGTGLVPSLEQIAEVHGAVRTDLVEMMADGNMVRILYGGSVKPDNAADVFGVSEVNGALVGGASLKAGDFLAIVRAYSAS